MNKRSIFLIVISLIYSNVANARMDIGGIVLLGAQESAEFVSTNGGLANVITQLDKQGYAVGLTFLKSGDGCSQYLHITQRMIEFRVPVANPTGGKVLFLNFNIADIDKSDSGFRRVFEIARGIAWKAYDRSLFGEIPIPLAMFHKGGRWASISPLQYMIDGGREWVDFTDTLSEFYNDELVKLGYSKKRISAERKKYNSEREFKESRFFRNFETLLDARHEAKKACINRYVAALEGRLERLDSIEDLLR